MHFIFNGAKDDKATENFRIAQEYESDSFSIWGKKEIYQRIENLIRVNSEKVILSWYATFVEEPFFAIRNPDFILKEIYLATVNKNHVLHQLFSGDINSPIYGQLHLSYYIDNLAKNLRFVYDEQRLQEVKLENLFVNFLIYKFIDINLLNANDIKTKFDSLLNSINKFRYNYKSAIEIALLQHINADLRTNINIGTNAIGRRNFIEKRTIKDKVLLEERIKVLNNLRVDMSNLKG